MKRIQLKRQEFALRVGQDFVVTQTGLSRIATGIVVRSRRMHQTRQCPEGFGHGTRRKIDYSDLIDQERAAVYRVALKPKIGMFTHVRLRVATSPPPRGTVAKRIIQLFEELRGERRSVYG
jgi:hypothetical protein